MGSANSIVTIISHNAIRNPLWCAGNNYRDLLDRNSEVDFKTLLLNWKELADTIEHFVRTLHELIEIRDGLKECMGLTFDEIKLFILDICIH